MVLVILCGEERLRASIFPHMSEAFIKSYSAGYATGFIPVFGQAFALSTLAVDQFSAPIESLASFLDNKKNDYYEWLLGPGFSVAFFIGLAMMLGKIDGDYFNCTLLAALIASAINKGIPYLNSLVIDALTDPSKEKHSIIRGIVLGHLHGLALYAGILVGLRRVAGNDRALMGGAVLSSLSVLYLVSYRSIFCFK